jgi:hypothetical protein
MVLQPCLVVFSSSVLRLLLPSLPTVGDFAVAPHSFVGRQGSSFGRLISSRLQCGGFRLSLVGGCFSLPNARRDLVLLTSRRFRLPSVSAKCSPLPRRSPRRRSPLARVTATSDLFSLPNVQSCPVMVITLRPRVMRIVGTCCLASVKHPQPSTISRFRF